MEPDTTFCRLRHVPLPCVVCLEAGYEDLAQIQADPDLEAARSDPRFQNLMAKFNRGGGGGFFDSLLKGFQL